VSHQDPKQAFSGLLSALVTDLEARGASKISQTQTPSDEANSYYP